MNDLYYITFILVVKHVLILRVRTVYRVPEEMFNLYSEIKGGRIGAFTFLQRVVSI